MKNISFQLVWIGLRCSLDNSILKYAIFMAIAINFRRFVTDDPKKYDQAKFTPEIAVKELPAMEMVELVIERPCLKIIQNSKVINRILIITLLLFGAG